MARQFAFKPATARASLWRLDGGFIIEQAQAAAQRLVSFGTTARVVECGDAADGSQIL
jgi:hypothetical protein